MPKIQVDISDELLDDLRKKFEICAGSKIPIANRHLVQWCIERWVKEPAEPPEFPKKAAEPPKEILEVPEETPKTLENPETPETFETYPRRAAPRLKDVLEAIKRYEDNP